jgi:hypothetical protein
MPSLLALINAISIPAKKPVKISDTIRSDKIMGCPIATGLEMPG